MGVYVFVDIYTSTYIRNMVHVSHKGSLKYQTSKESITGPVGNWLGIWVFTWLYKNLHFLNNLLLFKTFL